LFRCARSRRGKREILPARALAMGTRQGPKQVSSHFPRRKYMTVRPHAGHGCACYLQSQFSATERPTMRTFTLQTSDGLALQVHHSSARQPVRAALLLIHGMSEHAARYAAFGEVLTAAGIEFYAPDLRGHGLTGRQQGLLGHFADHEGWQRVLADLHELETLIRSRHPQTPLLLFGHSMGSYLAQAYLMRHGCGFAGAVLS